MSEPGMCHQKSLCAVSRNVLRWSQGWGTQPAGRHFPLMARRMREMPRNTVRLPESWLDGEAAAVWFLENFDLSWKRSTEVGHCRRGRSYG